MQKEGKLALREGAKPMTRRKFSPAFKRKAVEEHLTDGRRLSEICRQYQLCHSVFRHWRQQYGDNDGTGF